MCMATFQDNSLLCLEKALLIPPFTDFHHHRLKEEPKTSLVFVMDDNMPLRSMRYEFFQLARKCKASWDVRPLGVKMVCGRLLEDYYF